MIMSEGNVCNEFIWVEKYRPHKLDDCVLTNELKKTLYKFVEKGDVPNLLLHGTQGVGKTTVARAILDELGCDYLMINGSEESGIDVLRNKIKQFASSISFSGGRKFVLIDEADYLNPQSVQPALRGFMEEFSSNCGFILTCNFVDKILKPIHSRCVVVSFQIPKKERPKIASQFFNRVKTILDSESVEYDEKIVAKLLQNHFPDFRRVLNELQRYSVGGKIDEGIFHNSDTDFDELVGYLKDNNFTKMREWVGMNLDFDPQRVYRKIYDLMYKHMKPDLIPQVVLILADYQYKSSFSADQEICLCACLTEIMCGEVMK